MRTELIVSVDGQERTIVVSDVLVVGRSPKADLQLDHPSVSRTHLKVLCHDGLLTLVDAGSDNGTYLNGARVQAPERLGPSDRIKLGPYQLSIRIASAGVAREATPSADASGRIRTLWPPPAAIGVPGAAPGGMPPAPAVPLAVGGHGTSEAATARLEVIDPLPGATPTAFRDAVRMGDFAVMVLVGTIEELGADRGAALADIRRGLRDVAKINGSPEAVMRTLNGSLRALKTLASVVCDRLDLVDRRLTYACAAHDPPWLVRRDQKNVKLPAAPSVELGRVPLARFVQQQTVLTEGDVAIFVSKELTQLLEAAARIPIPSNTPDDVAYAAEWLRRARGQGVALPWQGGCAVCVGVA